MKFRITRYRNGATLETYVFPDAVTDYEDDNDLMADLSSDLADLAESLLSGDSFTIECLS